MPKPSLYARVSQGLVAMAWATVASAAGEGEHRATQAPPPCAACLVLAVSPEQASALAIDLHGLEILVREEGVDQDIHAALETVRVHGGRPGLWRDRLDRAAASAETLGRAHRVVLDLSGEPHASDDLVFRLKTHVTELRSARPGQLVGLHAKPELLDDLRRRELSAYIDFEVRTVDRRPAFPPGLPPSVTVMGLEEAGEPRQGPSARMILWLPPDPSLAQAIVADLARAAPILTEDLVPGGTVEVRCGGRPVETFLNPESLETVAVVRGCPPNQIAVAPDRPDSVRTALSTGEILVSVPSPEGRYAQGVEVTGTRTLTVREIIARHQAAAARQRRLVARLISTGRMTLTFEAPGFPAPIAVTTDSVIYTARGVSEIEQRDIRVNGIAFGPDRVPRLPLLEPERVASPPLAIALTDVYRYSLDGEARVDGVLCYIVKFEPIDRTRTLYAGRTWIAADDFGMVKVSAVQTNLRGAIVSSEQSDQFRREAESVWLLARSEVHQIYEGAGHRTPIHRLLTIDRHEINPPSFEARRQAAYASPSIMLRDTPEGFRYLRRERSDGEGAGETRPVVTGAAERVRTVAMGVIVDPNISRPLPFAGLSYVDFNLLGTGTQMNGFFGGTFGQLAIAVPSVGRSRWQIGARAFGIVSSYNDRAFIDGREEYSANIAQRPAHASIWLLRPITPTVTVRAGYEFDFTAYDRVDSTSASFVVPAAQAAHGLRLGIEAQRGPWSASAWWSGARRAGWREWGEGGEYEPRHHDYQRFGAVVSRAFIPSPRLLGRVEAAWMSGRDLDRFSRYAFGSFDNRLRGYPSALIRYDRGGVVRGTAAWAVGRLLRLDGFLDAAHVRDPGFGAHGRPYVGTGAAAEVPAPFGTLLAIEWGYGFQGLDSQGRRGTQVVRISGYKMF